MYFPRPYKACYNNTLQDCYNVVLWVLPGFTEFYWVLLVFTGFYLVLLVFYRVLLGFTGFYWVLPALLAFEWVLLVSSVFYSTMRGSTEFPLKATCSFLCVCVDFD